MYIYSFTYYMNVDRLLYYFREGVGGSKWEQPGQSYIPICSCPPVSPYQAPTHCEGTPTDEMSQVWCATVVKTLILPRPCSTSTHPLVYTIHPYIRPKSPSVDPHPYSSRPRRYTHKPNKTTCGKSMWHCGFYMLLSPLNPAARVLNHH